MRINVSAFHYKITLTLSNSISRDDDVHKGLVSDWRGWFPALGQTSAPIYSRAGPIKETRPEAETCRSERTSVRRRVSVCSGVKERKRLHVVLQTQKLNCCDSLLSYNWQHPCPQPNLGVCLCHSASVCVWEIQPHTCTLYMLNRRNFPQTDENGSQSRMRHFWPSIISSPLESESARMMSSRIKQKKMNRDVVNEGGWCSTATYAWHPSSVTSPPFGNDQAGCDRGKVKCTL